MKIGYNPLNTIPRDIVAKKVVYNDGDHYNPKVKSNTHLYSTERLPIRNWDEIPFKVKNDPNFKDFTHMQIGWFEVIGIFNCSTFDKWVLRCCCGNYEIRRTKTLKKIDITNPSQNRCQACLDTERIRNHDYFKIHGKYPWDGERKTLKKRYKEQNESI